MAERTEIVISASDQTRAGFASVQANMRGLETSLGGVRSVAAGIPALFSALAASAAVIKFDGIVSAGDEMFDMSQRTGIAVKELAGFKLAAEQSGTSLGGIATGVKGLANAMQAHGAEFKALGFETKDTGKAFNQLADVFAAMPDGLEKTSLAVKVFGRSGLELIPLLNLGSKGLQEAAEKSQNYAKAMALLAPEADKFKDTLAEMKVNADALWANLAVKLVPELNEIAKASALAAQEGGLLLSIWVAMGGVAQKLLFDRPKKSIQDLTAEIESLTASYDKMLVTGDNRSSFEKLFSLGDDAPTKIKKAQEYLTSLRRDLKALQDESAPKASEKDDAATTRLKQRAEALQKMFAAADGAKAVSKESAAIQSLTEQLDKGAGSASLFDKVMQRLTTGAWREFGATARVTLVSLAQQIDAQKRLAAEMDGTNKMLEKRAATEAKVDQMIEASRLAQEETNAALRFEASLSGQSEEAKKRALAIRQMELKTEKEILAIKKELQDPNEEAGSNPELERRLEEIRRNAGVAVAEYSKTADTVLARTQDWRAGVTDAWTAYAEMARAAGKASQEAMTRGFSMAEDALVDFVKTGKLNLKSLADYAATEFLRISVVRPAVASVGNAVKDSGGLWGSIKSLFGFASGGAFTVGGAGGTDSQLVAFKATPGEEVSVRTPAQQGGGGITIQQHIYPSPGVSSGDLMQAMVAAKNAALAEIHNSMRRGGTFA